MLYLCSLIFCTMETLKVIAGPCSAESREQLRQVAEEMANMPQVSMIRAGVWKPRTRPGGFDGIGEPALGWMHELSAEYGVRFCCEVAKPEHVELCLRHGIEDVWLGARTTANPFMVDELCVALRGMAMRVMVKNPLNPDVRLWIGAIERLKQSNITISAAIHRGFSMYDNHGYRNEPLWEVPMELHRRMPEVPLLCDPSHIAGRTDLVSSVAHAAMLLDFDGLMVEVHPHPADALTDAQQQLTPSQLLELVEELNSAPEHNTTDATGNVALLREKIDEVDYELLRLLSHRMGLSRQMADVKRSQQMSVYQPKRWDEVLYDRMSKAGTMGLDPAFIKEVFEKIHGESVRIQMEE